MGTRQAGAKTGGRRRTRAGRRYPEGPGPAEPGDTIMLKDGVYYQNVLIAEEERRESRSR